MKYRVNKNVEKNNYTVTFEIVEQSEQFQEAVKDFGDKVILIGGDFTKKVTKTVKVLEKQLVTETKPVFEEDGVTPVYEADGVTQVTEEVQVEVEVEVEKQVEEDEVVLALDKSYKYFPKDFTEAYTRTFSKAHYGDKVEEVANTYEVEMRKRIDALVAEYKTKVDTFSSTNEYIV